MSTVHLISKTASSRVLAIYSDKVLSKPGKHLHVKDPVSTLQPQTARKFFQSKNFWWGVGSSSIATAISYAVLKAEQSTKQLEKHLHVLQSKIKLESKNKYIPVGFFLNGLLGGFTGALFVASGISSFLEGKTDGESTGIKDWDKDNHSFIRGWKHGLSHSEAGLEKYRDSRDRLNISAEGYSLADKTRASLAQPRIPRFGSDRSGLPKASFLERLKNLTTKSHWLEWGTLSVGTLLSYGLLKRNQLNGFKKQIKMLQFRLHAMQKKEETVFLQSIATLGITAVLIPLAQVLEPFWSGLGYKHGYKKGLHDPNAEELNFKAGFAIGLTDPAAKPDPALVAVTGQEESWAKEVGLWLHRLK